MNHGEVRYCPSLNELFSTVTENVRRDKDATYNQDGAIWSIPTNLNN